MTPWVIINAFASIIVTVIVVYKMAWLHSKFIATEMLGMGMIGAAVVLNIGPIVARGFAFGATLDTPFDDWASTMLRVGLAFYFYGRISRLWKHDRPNKRMVEQGRAHQARKQG
jgi:hypothetical protein